MQDDNHARWDTAIAPLRIGACRYEEYVFRTSGVSIFGLYLTGPAFSRLRAFLLRIHGLRHLHVDRAAGSAESWTSGTTELMLAPGTTFNYGGHDGIPDLAQA